MHPTTELTQNNSACFGNVDIAARACQGSPSKRKWLRDSHSPSDYFCAYEIRPDSFIHIFRCAVDECTAGFVHCK